MTGPVRHIALFRWKEGVDVDSARIMETLRAIVDAIDGASDLVIGDALGLAAGLDFGLSVDFVDDDAYLRYRHDQRHQALLLDVLVPVSDVVSAIQLRLPGQD